MDGLEVTAWRPAIDGRPGPIYLRIVEALAEAMKRGTLQPGERLPAQRDLAQRLGVDLTTVSRAFMEARRRNLIDAAPGRGTFVTAGAWEEPVLDLSMNIPPSPQGLSLPALIRGGTDALLRRSSAEALLSYHPGPGSPAERAAASMWLSGRGDRLPVERIAVGAGAQALLAAFLLAGSGEGDTVLCDPLTYPGMIALARSLKRVLLAVESDALGMRPDRLEARVRETAARVVYLSPTLHNPTTLIMPATRRVELAAVARRCGVAILEDDPYGRLPATAPPSFLSIAPDVTYHVATLSKCISPFLRTAFLVAPTAADLDRVATHLRQLTLMAAPLMTGLAAEWIRSGVADEIVAGVRAETAARQRLAASILSVPPRVDDAGLHIWLPLAQGRTATVLEAARRKSLAVSGGAEFAVGDGAPDAMRIALGAVAGRDKLAEALGSLAAILRTGTDRSATLV